MYEVRTESSVTGYLGAKNPMAFSVTFPWAQRLVPEFPGYQRVAGDRLGFLNYDVFVVGCVQKMLGQGCEVSLPKAPIASPP